MAIDEKLIEYFKELTWPGIEFKENAISIPNGNILEFKNSIYTLKFFWYNPNERNFGERSRPTFYFKSDFDVRQILYLTESKYDVLSSALLSGILKKQGEIEEIKIDANYTGIRIRKNTLTITPEIILSLFDDLDLSYSEIKSHKGAMTRYHINKVNNKFFRKKVKEVTTTKPGAFKFLVDRFNLSAKKNKKDYLKYLSEQDVTSLQSLTEHLIKNEVFSEEYFRILDEFFIKEKLRDIINLGKRILGLKSTKLDTQKARGVINKVSGGKKIKQLETVWQEYFRRNLLYLIFSYKKIYSKVKLVDIEGDKKYPDFIGINHYNGVDIIEIKTHLTNILTWDDSHKNFSFSNEMSKAIIQTMNYIDAVVQRRFQDPDSMDKITEYTDEENLYHPRGVIIISSHDRLTKKKLSGSQQKALERDFTKLRNSLNSIEILTFDEVLKIADDYIKNIRSDENG